MAAVANIVLADAQATPVNHTFVPLGPDTNGVWWWEDQTTGVAEVGWNKISAQLIRPSAPAPGTSSSQRVSRVKLALHTPKLETLGTNDAGMTPPPQVAYIVRASVEYLLPERGALQDRKDIRKFCQFLQADAQIVAMVESLQNVY